MFAPRSALGWAHSQQEGPRERARLGPQSALHVEGRRVEAPDLRHGGDCRMVKPGRAQHAGRRTVLREHLRGHLPTALADGEGGGPAHLVQHDAAVVGLRQLAGLALVGVPQLSNLGLADGEGGPRARGGDLWARQLAGRQVVVPRPGPALGAVEGLHRRGAPLRVPRRAFERQVPHHAWPRGRARAQVRQGRRGRRHGPRARARRGAPLERGTP
mmetsp:Transcript_100832/g.271128  ORF Transcript_100832/g.271128 Transcript_100832/m.271128 type:complete len:215 (+) Transcript_100832:24-668(+)